MALDTTISGALEVRRADLDRFEQTTGGVFEFTITLDTDGVGETTVPINFPCRFVEQPMVLDGWSMKPSQRLKAGFYPVISAGVYVWKMGKALDSGTQFFDGATIAINVFNGSPDLLATVHLSFRGKALRNPAGQ